jgi:hypothetical protein
VRPRLEVLEERRVLSTLTVTSSLDGPFVSNLRSEIAAAQPGDTIVFDPRLNYQTLTLGYGQLEINKNLTIQGPGAGLLAIDGGGARVFQVDAGASVSISGLTIEGGTGQKYATALGGVTSDGTPDLYDGYGGGILNLGTLTLSGCTVTNNTDGNQWGGALGLYAGGGGIYNHGTMTLSSCTVTANSSYGWATAYWNSYGGGVSNDGTMTLSSCTVTGNSANSVPPITGTMKPSVGGGIYNGGTMTLSGSSVTGNIANAGGAGGGIFNATQENLTIRSSVVQNNTASEGGGIDNGGTTTLSGSTLTGNSATSGGAIFNHGTMTLSGSSVTGNTATSGGGIFNDKQGNLTILSSVVLNNTASDGADICNLGSMKISKDSQVGQVSKK